METTDRKLRMSEELRAAIEASANAEGISMNSEMIRRLQASLEQDRALAEREHSLAEAMVLAYGPDNGPLVHLIGEVIGLFAPRGQWRDDPTLNSQILRGIARLLQRLQAPDDAHIHRGGRTPEAKVDRLLFELGNDGSETRGPLFREHRWAAEVRRRVGPFGPLLIEMRRLVKEHLESLPPGEPPEPRSRARGDVV